MRIPPFLFLLLLGDRAQVVHDVPDLLVLQLVLERHHVEVRRHAVLDVVEDLAVGRAVVPLVVDEARRGGNQVVARPAFAVDAVTRRAVSCKSAFRRRPTPASRPQDSSPLPLRDCPAPRCRFARDHASASAAMIVRKRRESTRFSPLKGHFSAARYPLPSIYYSAIPCLLSVVVWR